MTLRADRVVIAGDQVSISGVATGLTGGLVRCTIKRYQNTADAQAVAEGDSLDGGVVVTGDTDFVATFASTVTEDWPIGQLWYDVQLVDASSEVYTLARGALTTLRRITRTRSVPGAHVPLSAEMAALTLTGADAALSAGRGVVAEGGSLVIAAADATLSVVHRVDAEAASLTVAGADASLVAARKLTAEVSALTLTGADATLAKGVDISAIVSALGSRLMFWFEVGVSSETLNGSNFSQLNDIGPSARHVVQATAGNQPSKVTGGGPNSKNCITYQGTTRHLNKTTAGITAGRMLSFFGVSQATTGAGAFRSQWITRSTASSAVAYAGTASTANFESGIRCNGFSSDDKIITSPAIDANWHVWSTKYATGVVPVTKIDNVAVSPVYTVGTGAAIEVDVITLGHLTLAAGSFYMVCCVEDCTATEEAMIRSYINFQTGL